MEGGICKAFVDWPVTIKDKLNDIQEADEKNFKLPWS